MHDPLAWLDDELSALETAGLRRGLAFRSTPQSAERIEWNGKPLVNFGSNDYLGIAAELGTSEEVCSALQTAGWGAGASPLISGRGSYHARLETAIAAFEGTAAALLFPTGYAANMGTIPALVGPGDLICSDELNHASLIDGCRLSGAKVLVYRHGDVNHLRTLLQSVRDARRTLIVTDGLFSMDGDLAPLTDLATIAADHQAMLMVDEAHATGVFGEQGRGVTEHLGVEAGVHIRVGTLSKALGSLGGFVAGSQQLIDWLMNRARPYFFSTACPEPVAAAGLAAIRIVQDEPHRRRELLTRAAELRDSLRTQGWPMPEHGSQIIPLRVGDPQRTMQLAQELRNRGFFVPGIRPPSVPAGQSLLRVSLSWQHSRETLQRLLSETVAIRRAL